MVRLLAGVDDDVAAVAVAVEWRALASMAMTTQALGKKKLARIARIVGEPVRHASVRGGWEHYWASVTLASGKDLMVNWRTGELASSRFAGLEYPLVLEPEKHIVVRDGRRCDI